MEPEAGSQEHNQIQKTANREAVMLKIAEYFYCRHNIFNKILNLGSKYVSSIQQSTLMMVVRLELKKKINFKRSLPARKHKLVQ